MHNDNFAFATLRGALGRPDAVAFGGTAPVAYQRYADLVVHFAHRMREFGVDRNSTVGLAVKSPVVACVAVTAVALLGSRWLSHFHDAPAYVPRCTHVFAGMGESGIGWFEFTKSWFEAPHAGVADLDEFAGNESGGDLWMIAHSSGTTGRAKYMPISYETAWRRISGNPELVDDAPMVLASLFGPTAYVGIRPRLGNLFAGGTNVNASSFARLRAGGVNRVMGSPAQISALVQRHPEVPLSRIRSCRVTGAAVTQQFVERALRYFQEIQVLYGSTEAGVITLASFTDDKPYDGSTGHPLEGAGLEVVDDTGTPVPVGTEGTVRIRTEWTVPYYIGAPQLSATVFQDGWFLPGDLGYLDALGALHITGRKGDVLNIAGTKLNAAEVDEVLQLHPDVVDGYCFLEKDEHGSDVLAAIVALRSGAPTAGASTIYDLTVKRMGRAKSPKRLYVTDMVLRNENGKPMRAESAKAAQGLTRIERD